MTLIRVWDRAPYSVDYAPGQGEDLVICFSSIGHDATRAPSPEFFGAATAGGRPALFVMDESRSWANDPGFAPAILGALAAVAPARRILTLGLSMGGFCALVAAEVVPVTAVLAFGPQFTIDPARLPDARWQDWTARITFLRYPTAPLARGPQITLMHGLADDAAQALAFPEQANLDHLLFPGLGHSDLLPHLKARGCLPGLVSAALSGDRRRLIRIATGAGGQRRARLQLPR